MKAKLMQGLEEIYCMENMLQYMVYNKFMVDFYF